MTECLYLNDAYLTSCEAIVTAAGPEGIVLDRTVFYPRGGGQPGDSGTLTLAQDSVIRIEETCYGAERQILHVPAEDGALPAAGDNLIAKIDWERRYRHMRMHSCLHYLGIALPYGVTGGSIGETRSRLDFDLSEPIDKQVVTEQLNALIGKDCELETIWTNWEELERRPDLIRTLSVQPPKNASEIRLLKIADLDLQPCGGTHVRHSSEIGRVNVTKTEKKGSRNRRVYVELLDP